MEASNKSKCVYFKPGKPDSCKYGQGCRYSHDIDHSEKELKKEDKHKYTQKEKIKPQIKEKLQKEYQKEEKPHRFQAKENNNGNAEAQKKIAYLTTLMESLKHDCRKCSKHAHLVITSCGCQSVCNVCASKVEKCPTCGSAILKDLFISGAV